MDATCIEAANPLFVHAGGKHAFGIGRSLIRLWRKQLRLEGPKKRILRSEIFALSESTTLGVEGPLGVRLPMRQRSQLVLTEQNSGGTSTASSTPLVASSDEASTTPRHDPYHDPDPRPELVEQCIRPRHCSLAEGDAREWMHRRLSHLGHVFNERGATYMACVWFELSFAARPDAVAELISAINMRMKLGQWALVEALYRRIVRMDLSKEERDAAYRKLGEATSLKSARGRLRDSSSSTSPASDGTGASACAASPGRLVMQPQTPLSASHSKAAPGASSAASSALDARFEGLSAAEAELGLVLDAPALVTSASSLTPKQIERLLPLVRGCAFAANKACELEAAQHWFEASYALSCSDCL